MVTLSSVMDRVFCEARKITDQSESGARRGEPIDSLLPIGCWSESHRTALKSKFKTSSKRRSSKRTTPRQQSAADLYGRAAADSGRNA